MKVSKSSDPEVMVESGPLLDRAPVPARHRRGGRRPRRFPRSGHPIFRGFLGFGTRGGVFPRTKAAGRTASVERERTVGRRRWATHSSPATSKTCRTTTDWVEPSTRASLAPWAACGSVSPLRSDSLLLAAQATCPAERESPSIRVRSTWTCHQPPRMRRCDRGAQKRSDFGVAPIGRITPKG
jgi:hypothetical protein